MSTFPAEAALTAGTLGISYSGSGFLIAYYVGVHAVLRALGVINTTTKLAGSSGGAVAAAIGCSDVPALAFLGTVTTLATTCRQTIVTPTATLTNCNQSLDTAVRTGLTGALPLDAATRCAGRLHVAVTRALSGSSADQGFLLVPPSTTLLTALTARTTLINWLAASSYLPRFSGPSLVTLLNTTWYAYDGVGAIPIPVFPATAGVTHTVYVSARATGATPADFSSLITAGNANTSRLDPVSAAYWPLNPMLRPQPAAINIFPGLSDVPLGGTNAATGSAKYTAAQWDSFLQTAPSRDDIQSLFDQGRADAATWVIANIPSRATNVPAALFATAFTVPF